MNNKRFGKALRRVARLARLTRRITREEWKEVRSIVRNPVRVTKEGVTVNLLDEIAKDLNYALVAEGKVGVNVKISEIDWDSLLAFLKEFLPLILEFIKALMVLF